MGSTPSPGASEREGCGGGEAGRERALERSDLMMISRYARRKFNINIPRTLDINSACIKTLCMERRRGTSASCISWDFYVGNGLDIRELLQSLFFFLNLKANVLFIMNRLIWCKRYLNRFFCFNNFVISFPCELQSFWVVLYFLYTFREQMCLTILPKIGVRILVQEQLKNSDTFLLFHDPLKLLLKTLL